MKKKVMKKWVKALRSGQYNQTEGALARHRNGEDGFCCLGVLCNIMQEETGKLNVIYGGNTYRFNDEEGTLPKAVRIWAGMENESGYFKYKNGKAGELTDLNDNGKSFKQIANVIEKNCENI